MDAKFPINFWLKYCYSKVINFKEVKEMLLKKFQAWTQNVEKKERGYEFIYCCNNQCIYREEEYMMHLQYIMVALWKDGKVTILHEYDESKESNNSTTVALVIKKQKKVILSVNEMELLYSIGLDEDNSQDRLIIFYRCNGMATIMTFTNEPSKSTYADYMYDDSTDKVQEMLSMLLHSIANSNDMQVKEGTSDARTFDKASE